ncbi:MAG: HDOD domain-containing protein [Hahellaceae bacterium]|nr:HDOD domain-containing protein [Hahellaceae bacterium]MCP5168466.1 HDOD domain-containing protein [Hahellaceae bacterium]
MILMHDVLGRVQVILPANCLLDIDRLNRDLGRSLKVLPSDDLQDLQHALSVTTLPAMPDITGLPSLIDKRVDDMEYMHLESGHRGKMLRISKPLFKAMVKNARIESFAVPVQGIQVNISQPAHDREQIASAVQKFTHLRIRQRLEDTLELPPLPQTAQKIIHLRTDPNAGIADLADIVEADPSLAAQVVSWASSSFYAAPGKIKSVHDAIMRVLGYDLVMNLAMGLSLGKTLQLPKEQPEGYLPYWQQSIWMATATGALVNAIPREHRPGFGLAYLSGLLHNFGYLVLAHVFPPHFELMCRYIEANPHLDSAYVEHYLLGITREQVGSTLMDIWNMPEEVVGALRQQKNPFFDGMSSDYANILFVARSHLTERGILSGPSERIPEELYKHLQLDPAIAAEVMDDLINSKEEVLQMAGLLDKA